MLENIFDIDIALENQKLFHLKLKPNLNSGSLYSIPRELEVKTSTLFLWHIFVGFMKRELYKTFWCISISFRKLMKLQSFKFSVSDVVPVNLQ